jgi:hypothetical protein
VVSCSFRDIFIHTSAPAESQTPVVMNEKAKFSATIGATVVRFLHRAVLSVEAPTTTLAKSAMSADYDAS